MTFKLSRVVVIDDAFGPPAQGEVNARDKDAWVEAVYESAALVDEIRPHFLTIEQSDPERFLDELLASHANIEALWRKKRQGALPNAKLDVLFKTAEQVSYAKSDKASVIVDTLRAKLGEQGVVTFEDYDSAKEALVDADIAFVDFFLANNTDPGVALETIASAATILKRPKLIFIMSSRASLDTQKQVRSKLDVRSAFFEVMQKSDITPEFIVAKIDAKTKAYPANLALEGIIDEAVSSTRDALDDFHARCKELEVHDLRLLDLGRLSSEGENLPEYLTWLFSETLAAKTRRLAQNKKQEKTIQADAIGFTGQFGQGQVLFDFFSEVVFGAPRAAGDGLRFGEVLRNKVKPDKYLLILTPACDLQRCSEDKLVLCTHALASDYKSPKLLVQEKLFGKRGDGKLCHLYTEGTTPPSHYLLDWQCGEVETHTVKDLCGDGFERVALMNELFAQEVKEESLRLLGRVGTQIDPSPLHVLDATIRFRKKNVEVTEPVPHDSFLSAIITYTEQLEKPKSAPAVIFSDEFKQWAQKTVRSSFGGDAVDSKLSNALVALNDSTRIRFRNSFNDNGFVVSVANKQAIPALDSKTILEVILFAE